MKIILLQDEKKLGKKGEIIEVSDGYARNYVLPKKIGVEATPKNLNDLKLQKANADKVALEQLNDAKALAEVLGEKTVEVKMKAGEGGRAFGSVSSKEIAAECKAQHGIEIDKKIWYSNNQLYAKNPRTSVPIYRACPGSCATLNKHLGGYTHGIRS